MCAVFRPSLFLFQFLFQYNYYVCLNCVLLFIPSTHLATIKTSHGLQGYGPSAKLIFDDNEDKYELWEVKFKT